MDPESINYFTPQQIGIYIGQVVTLIGTLAAILIAIIGKKTRTPSDNLAQQDFAYKLLKERLDEANADRKVLTDTVNYLREDARKRDVKDSEDFEREQLRLDLIRSMNERISQLTEKVTELERRQDNIAFKVRKGIPITLTDIYGEGFHEEVEGLGDVELTINPNRGN